MECDQLSKAESKSRQYNMVYKILSYPKEERDKEDIEFLKLYFNDVKLFKDMETQLPKVQFDQLFTELKIESYKMHKTVFRFGEPNFKYYIILEGSVYVLTPETNGSILQQNNEINNLDEQQQKEIDIIIKQNPNMQINDILKEGQSIGDGVFKQKFTRGFTAVCRENTTFASINSDAYYHIVEKYFIRIQEEKIEFLRKFPFLSVWSNAHLSNLLTTIKIREYTKNSIVYKKQDPVQYIFLIRSGEFELIQDIEALEEDSEQPMEQYKQNIEQFYESFNQLNVQFHRSKQQELKKKQRIALLGYGQSFGINEVAENLSKRQVSAVCTSLKGEVYMLDKSVYLNSIKDKQIYNDFLKENQLKQNWRNKHLESSKNLFQKIDYRKYNIQTNKSVKQIKGLCEITIDGSLIKGKESPRQNNFIHNQSQPSLESTSQYSTKCAMTKLNLIDSSFLKPDTSSCTHRIMEQHNNTANNKSERYSLSPKLEKEFIELQNDYKNGQLKPKYTKTRILLNNNLIAKSSKTDTHSIENLQSQTDREYNQQNSILSQSHTTKQHNFSSQRSILSSILKGAILNDNIRTTKNNNQSRLLSANTNNGFSQKDQTLIDDNLQKLSQILDSSTGRPSTSQLQKTSSHILQKLAASPKSFYEEEILNKLSINMTEKDIKKKNKQAQKYNAIKLKSSNQKAQKDPQNVVKKQYNCNTTRAESNTQTSRSSLNTQLNNSNSSRRIISLLKKGKKKSLEVIRSEKLDSAASLETQQFFDTKDLNDRFKQMLEIEIEMQDQYGRLQPQQSIDSQQNLKSRNSFPSSQSLKCFEKSFADAQSIVNKKQYLDSLTQKQYFNDIKQSLNLDKEKALNSEILKRTSIEYPPTIPTFQSIQSIQRSVHTPGNTTSNRMSMFFSASRDTMNGQSPSAAIPSFMNENNLNEEIKDQPVDTPKGKKQDIFSYLINKNKFNIQDKDQHIEIHNNNEQQPILKKHIGTQMTKFASPTNQTNQHNISQAEEDCLWKKSIITNQINGESENNVIVHKPFHKINYQTQNSNRLCSPINNNSRIASLNSIKNEDNMQSESSQKNKRKKKPYVIDYNFIDSSYSSKHTKKQVERHIPYIESQLTTHQHISSQYLESVNNCDQYSPLKYKRSLMIECEEQQPFAQKSPLSSQSQGITPSKFSQINSVNHLPLQLKFENAKKSPNYNITNQLELSSFHSPQNATPSLAQAGGLSSKSTASSSRPKLFKNETLNMDIQSNKPSSSSSQRQFLYQLLNRNQINQHNPYNSKNDIPLQPDQQSLYKFQESYYRIPINQSVITAYSSPRQLVFKINNKDQNTSLTNSVTNNLNSSLNKKTPRILTQPNQSTHL